MNKQELAGKDLDDLMYWLIAGLKPGNSFSVGKNKISIASIAKDKSMRWDVNGTKKKVYHTHGVYYGHNGKARKPDWFFQLIRDIEGWLTVDLINVNNPFHELSDIAKLIQVIP
jgi:hypothetical protein